MTPPNNLFDPSTPPKPLLRRIQARPAAQHRYVIFFTPRSGSSWLTGIIEQASRMGHAQEVFNPDFCALHIEEKGISSLDQFVDMVVRRDNCDGVFSFEITAHQLTETFGDPATFQNYFGTDPLFWLIRKDIVAQAVSLAKMVATQVGQSVDVSADQRAAADVAFTYDPEALKYWLEHILAAERMTEAWLAQWNAQPLRMAYEQIVTLTPDQVLNVIARHAGLPDVPPLGVEARHVKLSTARNLEFAGRFRAEHAEWLAPLERERRVWVDKLDDVTRLVADL